MAQRKNTVRSACPIANVLDLVGDKWTLLVLRDLIFYGRREFGEFLVSGEGIATNILSDRLDRLCCAGLVARFDHPTNGKKFVYRATEKALDMIPMMIEMVLWGERHLPMVKVPAERLKPLVSDRTNFIKALRQSLAQEFRAAGRPLPLDCSRR